MKLRAAVRGRGRSSARLAAAAGGGVAAWASFPPLGWWWAAPLGVAALVLAVQGSSKRLAAAAGFVHGAAFLVLLLSFVRVFGVDAWLVLAVGESLFFLGLGLLLRPLTRLSWSPLAVAAAWVAEEAARDRFPFGGFPWGRLADAQAGGPFGPLAALGGAPLVTFAVGLAGALLAVAAGRLLALRASGTRPSRVGRSAGLAGAAAAAVTIVGLAVPLPTAGTTTAGPSRAQLAIVQGNVPRLGLDAFAQRYAVTAAHSAATVALARQVAAGQRPAPAAVIWPENSADEDPRTDPQTAALIRRAATAIGRPMLVGAVLDAAHHHLANAGIVWSPQSGAGATYLKQHLLPFGEYLPFRAELSRWIGRFALLPEDFLPGHRPGVLRLGPVRIADVICYEIADDAVVRAAVRGGGRVIVEQTNDASYERPGDDGSGGESAQQLQIARLRAIEHGRAVLVASTSGVSAVIRPDGSIAERTKVFQTAVLDVTVPLRDPLTLADRVGGWPEWVFCALAAAGLAAALRRGRRAPTPPDAAAANPRDQVPAAAA